MIELIILLAILGLIVWAVVTYIPMPPMIANLIIAVAVIGGLLFVLQAFGVMSSVSDIPVPQLD